MASIQQKTDRKFKITVCNGYHCDGRKIMKSKTITVPKEVPSRNITQYTMHQAEEFERNFKNGMAENDHMSFEEYAESWLKRQKRYKESTLASYRHQLKIVYSYIGGLPLRKIKPIILEDLCEKLRSRESRGKMLSESTVQKYLTTVSAVLQDARRNDIILYNPAHRVNLPVIKKAGQVIPSIEEANRLIECINRESIVYRTFYMLALATGCRRGELCALRWDDIHQSTVRIRRSRSSVQGKGIIEGATKNGKERIVLIGRAIWVYLFELQVEKGGMEKDISQEYIFSSEDGKPIHPDTFSRRLRRIFDRNGFPKSYHLHTLRHFFATYLLSNNISKQVAAELLGHGDTSFLEKTYCHPQTEYKERAANCIGAFIDPMESSFSVT